MGEDLNKYLLEETLEVSKQMKRCVPTLGSS